LCSIFVCNSCKEWTAREFVWNLIGVNFFCFISWRLLIFFRNGNLLISYSFKGTLLGRASSNLLLYHFLLGLDLLVKIHDWDQKDLRSGIHSFFQWSIVVFSHISLIFATFSLAIVRVIAFLHVIETFTENLVFGLYLILFLHVQLLTFLAHFKFFFLFLFLLTL